MRQPVSSFGNYCLRILYIYPSLNIVSTLFLLPLKDACLVSTIIPILSLKENLDFSGVSVVHFKVANNICDETSAFVNMLCIRYPSVKFIKVSIHVIILITMTYLIIV